MCILALCIIVRSYTSDLLANLHKLSTLYGHLLKSVGSFELLAEACQLTSLYCHCHADSGRNFVDHRSIKSPLQLYMIHKITETSHYFMEIIRNIHYSWDFGPQISRQVRFQ